MAALAPKAGSPVRVVMVHDNGAVGTGEVGAAKMKSHNKRQREAALTLTSWPVSRVAAGLAGLRRGNRLRGLTFCLRGGRGGCWRLTNVRRGGVVGGVGGESVRLEPVF